MQIDHPYHFDRRGRTGSTEPDDHVRDMIEQVLFTSPGERVNRPDFGCGLMQMVFSPAGPSLATALQITIMAALERWLGDVIAPHDVAVVAEDSAVWVRVEYTIRGRQAGRRVAVFDREVSS